MVTFTTLDTNKIPCADKTQVWEIVTNHPFNLNGMSFLSGRETSALIKNRSSILTYKHKTIIWEESFFLTFDLEKLRPKEVMCNPVGTTQTHSRCESVSQTASLTVTGAGVGFVCLHSAVGAHENRKNSKQVCPGGRGKGKMHATDAAKSRLAGARLTDRGWVRVAVFLVNLFLIPMFLQPDN